MIILNNILLAVDPTGIPLFPKPAETSSKIEGQGILGLVGVNADTSGAVFANIISTVIGLLTVVAFIWFFIKLLMGAIQLISSGGDKNKVAEARAGITTGLIGVVIVLSSIFIVRFVAEVLGIPDVLDIDKMITLLTKI